MFPKQVRLIFPMFVVLAALAMALQGASAQTPTTNTTVVVLDLNAFYADATINDDPLYAPITFGNARASYHNATGVPGVTIQSGHVGPTVNTTLLPNILGVNSSAPTGQVLGTGAWQALDVAGAGGTPAGGGDTPGDSKKEILIQPHLVLGLGAGNRFTVSDIIRIEWRTNRLTTVPASLNNWYASIWADDPAGPATALINFETRYVPGQPTENTWSQWTASTTGGFEPFQAVTAQGWFGNPVRLENFTTGALNWATFQPGSNSNANIDYRNHFVEAISIATASAWANDYNGYLDYIEIELDNNGTREILIFDLEGQLITQQPLIDKAFAPATIAPSATSALTLTLTNPSTSPMSGLTFTDQLPSGLTFTSTTATTTCNATVVVSGTLLTFTKGFLAAGGSCTVSIGVTGTTAGAYTNTTSALTTAMIGQGFGGGTDTASAVLTIAATTTTTTTTTTTGGDSAPAVAAAPASFADTSFIIKSVDKSIAQVGDTLTFTINYGNPKGNTLNNVVIADTFDSRLSNIQVVSSSIGTPVVSGNTVTLQGISLLPGQRATLTITAQISSAAKPGDVIGNTASLESPDASIHFSNVTLTTILPSALPATGASPLRALRLPALLMMALLVGVFVQRRRTLNHKV